MFASKELNEERAAVMVDALEREKAGYEARLAAVKDGHEDHRNEEQLADRVAQVEAEIARINGSPKKPQQRRRQPAASA